MVPFPGRPWKWHRLAHVCRKWRHVIFWSPRRLALRILCEDGAPIGSILASWPTLPLVAKVDADWKSEHIPRNVMLALGSPDRLCQIDLHVASSMLAPIVEVTQKRCQVLESVRITVEVPTGPSILVQNAFLGGSAPHLREIKLRGIAFPFPEIRRVLLSTNNLVELHLAKIPNNAYFAPNELVSGLSNLAQLKRLVIDFHSPASSPPPSMARPPPQRATLPSLESLDFHCASGYLEEFIARIDLPSLCKIAIKLFNDITFEIPQLCQLILGLNTLRSPDRVIVTHSVDSVGVYFVERNLSIENNNCFLGTTCRRLDWQVSFAAEILRQLSFLLSSVQSLYIQSGNGLPTEEEDVDSTQWLELFQPFTKVMHVYVWVKQLVPGIVQALVAEDMAAEVLPELTLLHLIGYLSSPSVVNVAEQFADTRRLSGRAVSLTSGDMVRHSSSYHTNYTEQQRWRQQQQWQHQLQLQQRREREQWREQEWQESAPQKREREQQEREQREWAQRQWEQRRRQREQRERERHHERERELEKVQWREQAHVRRQKGEQARRQVQVQVQQVLQWRRLQLQQQQQQQPQQTPQLPQPQQLPMVPIGSLPLGLQPMSGTGSVGQPPPNRIDVPNPQQTGQIWSDPGLVNPYEGKLKVSSSPRSTVKSLVAISNLGRLLPIQ